MSAVQLQSLINELINLFKNRAGKIALKAILLDPAK